MEFKMFLESDFDNLVNAVLANPRDMQRLSILGDWCEENGKYIDAEILHNASDKIIQVISGVRRNASYYDGINEVLNFTDVVTYLSAINSTGYEVDVEKSSLRKEQSDGGGPYERIISLRYKNKPLPDLTARLIFKLSNFI